MKLTIKTLKNANLSDRHYAQLVGVSAASIQKYFAKKNQKLEIVRKIELGAAVLAETQFVWPDIRYVPTAKIAKQYAKNKKASDRLDKKFATAYKKALKKAEQ